LKELIGSWKLVSFTLSKDGATEPWRHNVTGTLIYTDKGGMSVAMNSTVHPGDNLFDSILFYSGTWSSDTSKDGKVQVHHHIENATELTNIGKTLTRNVALDGDNLELSAEGTYGRASVTWKRRSS
jgi:hypothetical protein